MGKEMSFEIKRKNTFLHICTNLSIENWVEIKLKYNRIQKYKINNKFTPIIFSIKDLEKKETFNEYLMTILEGRKYNKITLLQFDKREEYYNFISKIDKGHRNIIVCNNLLL